METKTNTLKKAVIGMILSVVLIVIDQMTKLMAIHGLMNQQPFVILDGIFELHYLENRGAAFGILQGKKAFFIIFTILVLAFIAYIYLKRIPDEKKFRLLDGICILFFAGALGNFIDRVFRNYVVDFFYFKLIDFPIFNVADIYVTVAAFAMIILGLFYYKEDDYNKIFPAKKK
jgi:signal peptidase II